MIEQSIASLQTIIVDYGALGVFLATILQEVIAPIPSSLIATMAGFFLLPQDLSMVSVFLPLTFLIAIPVGLGITIGALVIYSIGHIGGQPAIESTKKWTRLDWEKIEMWKKRIFVGYADEIVLLILRILPMVPGPGISAVCGVIRYPVGRFIIITFIGTTIKAYVFGLLGWYLGSAYIQYLDTIERVQSKIIFWTVFVTIILILAFILLPKMRRYYKQKYNN